MDVLACGHVANEAEGRLCPHLVGVEEVVPYHRVLQGRGLVTDFVCEACDGEASGGGMPELVVVCEGCVERVESDTMEMVGWRGEPGVDERPEPVRARHLGVLGSPGLASPAAVAPFDEGWVTVAPDGGVWVHVEGDDRRVGDVAGVAEPSDGSRRSPTLAVHASGDGRFVAVVNDHGRTGVVLDVVTGATTLRLDRDGHHVEQTLFPAAFVTTREGDAVLVAAVGGSRLDAFDPATGRLLTGRGVMPAGWGDQRSSPAALGYYRGALHVSPDGCWVLEDGWIWDPVGSPLAWSVEHWLGGRTWEPDAGLSVIRLCTRAYLWDVAMCWVDERRVAIWGLGHDDLLMLDGVTVYDVEDGAVVAEFGGVPKGHLWSDGHRLFATGAGAGLSVWDPYTGQRTALVPDVEPIAFNRSLDQFLVVDEGGRLRRTRLEPATADPRDSSTSQRGIRAR